MNPALAAISTAWAAVVAAWIDCLSSVLSVKALMKSSITAKRLSAIIYEYKESRLLNVQSSIFLKIDRDC